MSEHAALRDKRVLVTGASRGIGRAVTAALMARGARLAVVGRDRDRLAALVDEARGEHAVLDADLADVAAAGSVVGRAVAALGGVDAFVSSAGVVEYAHGEALTDAALERQLAINVRAPVRIALDLARVMPDGGAMVFLASTLGWKPAPLTLAYGASKAALISATRSLALELAPRGIRVNAVAPGPVDTEMLRVVRYAPGEAPIEGEAAVLRIAGQLEALRRLHPLQRLATPDDIAHSVLYLLTAPYVTGNILPVDGGLLLGEGVP